MAANPSTLVHTQETSDFPPLPSSYRDYRSRHCELELQRTEWLYDHIDFLEGTSRLDKLRACRTDAWFARHIVTGEVRVISNSCRLRWCPICSKARSSYLCDQVQAWIESVQRPKFLTLTMKHTNASLQHQVKWLYEHFRRYRVRKLICSHIRGGIWFFQLKKTKTTETWHPHLHCVLDSDYIPQSLLSSEWLCQTKTSDVVDIRSIRSSKKIADYVARYCSRPANLHEYTEHECVEIFNVFHGRRLCGSWGTGRSVSLRPLPSSSISEWESCGSWKSVISQANSLPRAKVILKAYLTNTTIPKGLFVSAVTDVYDAMFDPSLPNIGIEDCAGRFEDFL